MPDLTPEQLLKGYSVGIFPMAEHRDDPDIFWVDPRLRGVFPIDGFHISRSLARVMRRTRFTVTIDTAFADVVRGCADREDTWINAEIFALNKALYDRGVAHSIEVWDGDELVGGVYGVTLGAAFFGESMFSRRDNASKIALACLIDRLKRGGFKLFDTQFLTPHLASLGAIEITRDSYHQQLEVAQHLTADFVSPAVASPQEVVQRMTQMS